MVDPQLERTARAICRVEAQRYADRLKQEPWIDLNWPQFVPHARAALEAQTGTESQPMPLDLTPTHRAAVEVMARALAGRVSFVGWDFDSINDHVRGQYLADATAALRALVEAGWWVARWEPIETAPKDGTEVITTRSRSYGQDVSTDWYAVDPMSTERGWLIGTTHWTPLPPPPPEARDADAE